MAMSIDHKPNTREERTRIEDAGGVVVWAGTWRVGGVLAVSRAFGDRPLKRYVIPTPDIREEGLSAADDCLILASDGLWDVISNQVIITGVGGAQQHMFSIVQLCLEGLYQEWACTERFLTA
jgi:protein phosphatase 1L